MPVTAAAEPATDAAEEPAAATPDAPDLIAASAELRARGNEPAWTLRIADDRISVTLNGGAATIEAPAAPPVPDGGTTTYVPTDKQRDLRVVTRRRLCTDTMTGMPHPLEVTLTIGGRELRGCGGHPAELLLGEEWIVQDISGTAVSAEDGVTVAFGRDARISGRAACNRYGGAFTLTGEGLTFSNLVSTKMACPEAVMALEGLFLDVLQRIQRFEIRADGVLVLHVGGDRGILARRP